METQFRQYEYFAFISYKREDEKWAKWLQHKLESYSLPTAVRKTNPELPKKIRPIFRDQSDLAGGNLKEEIEKGLEGSKFLIVICSPRAARSPWVSKEVEYFIQHGREEFIIPFIIGGVPNAIQSEEECFPEGLRKLKGEKELLGININEMGRDAAAIKVIASMFGLRFDVLWQRFRRNARKRKIYIAAGLLAILLMTIVFAVVLWRKNSEIERQNSQLNILVANLKEENKTYTQLRNATERYSYIGALRGNDSDDDLMYIAYHPTEPIIAFSDDWGFWIHYLKTNTEVLLPGSDEPYSTMNVEGLEFSEDGMLLTSSSWGGLFVWNVESNTLQKHIPISELLNTEIKPDFSAVDYYSQIISFDSLDGEKFEYAKNQLIIRSGDTSLFTELYPDVWSDRITVLKNPVYDELLFVGEHRAALYDENANDFIQFFKGYGSKFCFSPNGDYLKIGKDLFERNIRIDTITVESYSTRPIAQFPHAVEERSVRINEADEIEYDIGTRHKVIEVIKPYSNGNGQEFLSDAHFVKPNKIVAIVGQGKHRVYNANTGQLIGTLTNYVWDGNESYGHEQELSHAESYIVYSKVINRNLYVVSSGAIIRVYDIDKLRQIALIELPFQIESYKRMGAIDSCLINDDGSRIFYYFDGQEFFYECKI